MAVAASNSMPRESMAENRAETAGLNSAGSAGQTLGGMTAALGWPAGRSRPTCQNSFRSARVAPLAVSTRNGV